MTNVGLSGNEIILHEEINYMLVTIKLQRYDAIL